VIRVLIGGAAGLALTYGIGKEHHISLDELISRMGGSRDLTWLAGLCEHGGITTAKGPAMRRTGAPVEQFLAQVPDAGRRETHAACAP
jgi:hypothetical protein